MSNSRPSSSAARFWTKHPLWCHYVGLALLYTLFTAVASLSPWRVTWPSTDVWQQLWHRFPHVADGRPSLTDAASNVALFVPLGFIWSAVLLYRGSRRSRALRSLSLVACAAVFASLIELVQVWVPERSVSQYDPPAEVFGAVIGIAAWWVAGPAVSVWLSLRQRTERRARHLDWGFQIYSVLVTLLWLFPLDLTIRPAELFHKYRDGRVELQPFSGLTLPRLVTAGTTLLLFLPIGFWLPTAFTRYPHSLRSPRTCRLYILGLAILLTFGQMLVFSRQTDLLEVAGLILGLSGGAALAPMRRGKP